MKIYPDTKSNYYPSRFMNLRADIYKDFYCNKHGSAEMWDGVSYIFQNDEGVWISDGSCEESTQYA